jgi:hypothetical protein
MTTDKVERSDGGALERPPASRARGPLDRTEGRPTR